MYFNISDNLQARLLTQRVQWEEESDPGSFSTCERQDTYRHAGEPVDWASPHQSLQPYLVAGESAIGPVACRGAAALEVHRGGQRHVAAILGARGTHRLSLSAAGSPDPKVRSPSASSRRPLNTWQFPRRLLKSKLNFRRSPHCAGSAQA